MSLPFPPHAAALHLIHNDHKNLYESVEDWAANNIDRDDAWCDWVSPEERLAAIASDSVWTLQWYPNTPTGFYAKAASTLDALLIACQSIGDF